jgi:hypothetical protein
MRYIFIYYNILYLILIVLIFIYIKKVLNNCYNIENFDSTYNPQDSTNEPLDSIDDNTNVPLDSIYDSTNFPLDSIYDSTNFPKENNEDDIDRIFEPIIKGRRSFMKEKIISKIENDEREKYKVDPVDKTDIDDITLYESKYNDAEKLADEFKDKLVYT